MPTLYLKTMTAVALTAAVWAQCVAVPPGVVCQDEASRLWDVLFLLCTAIRRSRGEVGPGSRTSCFL